MKILLLLVVLVSLALVACGGDDDSESEFETIPVVQAMTFIHDDNTPGQVEPRGFAPPDSGEYDCLLPATPETYIEGTCEWKTSQSNDGGWVASLIETWKCEDYNALAGNSEFCTSETGTHQWDYVIAPDGTTTLYVQSGDPPPEGLGAGAPD